MKEKVYVKPLSDGKWGVYHMTVAESFIDDWRSRGPRVAFYNLSYEIGLFTYFRYAGDLLKHKWLVFVEACKLGIPRLGLIHDLSKFSPAEFPRAARKFYGQKKCNFYAPAWLHHQKRNKHHWIYWVVYMPLPGKDWDPEWGCIPMPHKYALEMLADWRGASKRFGKPVLEWYEQNRKGTLLHPLTRAWIERKIGYVS